MTPDDPRHGTNAGYIAHRKANEDACQDCRDGRARFERYRRYDNELGRPRKLPSIGARRRVRALQRMGWSLRMIANDAGWNSPEALQYVMLSESVSRRSWWRIANTYERLSMRTPPVSSASARARNRAIRLGYPSPLAWDDIDDPAAEPWIDDRPARRGRPEIVATQAEEFDFLIRQGESEELAAARLGIKRMDSFVDQRRRLEKKREAS